MRTFGFTILIVLICSISVCFAWEQTRFSPSISGWNERTFDPNESASARQSANDSGSEANSQLGSQDGVNSRMAAPLTGTGTNLTTLSGNQSGQSALSSNATSAYLQVFIQPGSSGDLQVLYMSQDMDFDGNFDYTYSPMKVVSGVCADGYISCDEGTWENCGYWAWEVNSGKITSTQTSIQSVSGCYCINNSCGSSLAFNNVERILNALGGGAAAALSAASPDHQITRAEVNPDSFTIVFYGQDMTEGQTTMTGGVNTNTTVTQTSYYARPGASAAASIDNDTSSMVAGQSADPTSLYSLVSGIQQDIGNTISDQTCLIKRIFDFFSATLRCSDPDPTGVTVIREQTTREYYQVYTGPRVWPGEDCRIGKNPYAFPDYHWTPMDGPVVGIVNSPPPDSIPTGFYEYIMTACDREDGADTAYYDTYEFYLLCTREIDYFTESIADGCVGLEADPNCLVRDETVDGVEILSNRGATGLVPQPSPKTFTGSLQTYQFVRPWWEKYRTYECTIDGETYDFDDALLRVAKAQETAGASELQDNRIDYTSLDKDPVTGIWTSTDAVIKLQSAGSTNDCDLRCKIKRPVISTGVKLSGTAEDVRADGTLPANEQWDFIYAVCTNSQCPTEAGDTIVKSCQCLNEFSEVATVLDALNQAGKDTICSSGERQ